MINNALADLFIRLVNLSISAAWLVPAVVIVRALLRKAPKWLSPVLWGLVGVRLLFPFSIESIFSLQPTAQTISTTHYVTRPYISSGIPAVDASLNSYMGARYCEGVTVPAHHFSNINAVLGTIWAVGAAVLLLYMAGSYLYFRHSVRTAVRLHDNIYQCDGIATPFVLGVFRPRIYLPYHLSPQAQQAVIAHEQAHIHRRDHWAKPIGFLLLTLYWFNPVLWAAYILFCRDIELACDERVVKTLTAQQRADYSQALLECSAPRRTAAVCPLAFGGVGVKQRIQSVLNYKKPAFWLSVLALVLCAAVAVCYFTVPRGVTRYTEVDLSDIPTMNIGAEMPLLLYADDDISVMNGTFGLLVYNQQAGKAVRRISYAQLEQLGITHLNAAVSADGKTVYLGNDDMNAAQQTYTYAFTVADGTVKPCSETGELFDGLKPCSDYGEGLSAGLTHSSMNTSTQHLGYLAAQNNGVVYYLLADADWSMESLRLVAHTMTGENSETVYSVFRDQAPQTITAQPNNGSADDTAQSEQVYSMVYKTPDYKTVVLQPQTGTFSFCYSMLSSYLPYGAYTLEDDTLTLRTDDGKYTYVFAVQDGALVFDASQSDEVPAFKGETPLADGAVFTLARTDLLPEESLQETLDKGEEVGFISEYSLAREEGMRDLSSAEQSADYYNKAQQVGTGLASDEPWFTMVVFEPESGLRKSRVKGVYPENRQTGVDCAWDGDYSIEGNRIHVIRTDEPDADFTLAADGASIADRHGVRYVRYRYA